MGKKKYRPPRDMKELEDIFYGGDYDKLKKYTDWMDSEILTEQREENLKKSVDPLFLVRKVKERKGIKTPDYIIEDEKLYIEVTSINAPVTISERYDQPDFVIKVNEVITHAEEKDKLDRENYDIGCVIFVDLITTLLGKMLDQEMLIEYVRNSNFLESDVSFLFFRATDASVMKSGQHTSTHKLFPPIIFVKNEEMKEKLSHLFTGCPQPEVIVNS